MTTRGIMLNNPMNIMSYPSITWNGEQKPTRDPDGRLCTFDNMSDGVRAGAKDLLSYFRHDGCKTMTQIVSRYAPPEENPTEEYIEFMCKYCGVTPDQPLDLESQTFLSLMVDGFIRFEQGPDVQLGTKDTEVATADIQQGVYEALLA